LRPAKLQAIYHIPHSVGFADDKISTVRGACHNVFVIGFLQHHCATGQIDLGHLVVGLQRLDEQVAMAYPPKHAHSNARHKNSDC
jgi:hypothetical protein